MHRSWNHAQRYRVGLLLCGSGVLLAALLVVVVGLRVGGERASYRLRFAESVKGLVVGSKVNFQGVPVGAVTDIRFAEGKTVVEVEVDRSLASIQEVTRGRLDRALVTGQVTVELEGYRPQVAALEPGAVIPVQPSPLTELARNMPDVLTEVSAFIGEARELVAAARALAGPQQRAQLAGLIEGVDVAARALPDRLGRSLDELDRGVAAVLPELRGTFVEARAAVAEVTAAAAELRRAAADAGALVRGDAVPRTLAAWRLAAERLATLEPRLAAVLVGLQEAMGDVRGPLHRVILGAQSTLAEVSALARKLRAAPSALLFGEAAVELAPGAPRGGGR